jgi:hypothetical protein
MHKPAQQRKVGASRSGQGCLGSPRSLLWVVPLYPVLTCRLWLLSNIALGCCRPVSAPRTAWHADGPRCLMLPQRKRARSQRCLGPNGARLQGYAGQQKTHRATRGKGQALACQWQQGETGPHSVSNTVQQGGQQCL